jgi:hypothetical protein
MMRGVSDEPFDQINRAVISIAALVVAFAALLIVLLAWAEPGGTIGRVADFAGYLDDHNNKEAKAIVSLGAIVVILLMAAIMILELTPSATQRMRIRTVKAGSATVSTVEIAERIERELATVPHIARSQAIVAACGDKVEVVLDLEVDPGADLTTTADEACRRAHELVEKQIGVPLVKLPRARLHYRELRLRTQAGRSSKAAQQAAAQQPAVPPTGWERPGETHDGGN